MLGIASAVAEEVFIPDGDFANGKGSWEENFGNGTTSYQYPEIGGNPTRFGVMNHTSGFGIWISNANQPLLLGDFGLVAGSVYTFLQDMRVLTGENVGGLKVDFFSGNSAAGSTGDLFATKIGDGTTWETYSFEIPIPVGVDGFKVVPLWGANSEVGYDNFRVENVALPSLDSIPNADFEIAGGASWFQDSEGGTFGFDFPGAGGSAGGYAVIDHSANDGGFGVLVANDNEVLLLNPLGLTAGETYLFSVDLRLFSGSSMGGLKVEFFNGTVGNGSTGEVFPEVIGTGATWETYDFEVSIPITATGIKVVALWGEGSVVGYDHFTFDPTPIQGGGISAVPNRGFESALSEWARGGEPNTIFSHETMGGNPDGYAVIENNGTGFGVLVSNSGAPIPLSGLGLEAGEAYRVFQDMRIFAGTNRGGLKVEFWEGAISRGDTGDVYPALIGDGSTWETYEFLVNIPSNANAIKFVPLWGAGSRVGYDNVTFSAQPVPTSPVLNADFENGMANWAEFQVGTTYQYPASGGNPGRFAQMSNNGAIDSYGVLVANNSVVIPKSKFGISAEGIYEFQVDMKILSGTTIGGLKVEFSVDGSAAGDTGDLFPSLIGDGSTWETYSFSVFIPGNVDGLEIVLLWGANSVVGFDNVVTPGTIGDGFETWIAGFPGVGDLTGFNDDPDGDGQANGLENFLGTDPSEWSAGLGIISVDASAGEFLFVHRINLDPVPQASTGRYFWSTDLENFYGNGESAPDGTSFIFDTNPGIPTTGNTRAVRATSTGPLVPSRLFVQLRVSGAVEK